MAGGKSTTYETSVLNTERGTNITAPANTYVGLYTAVPTDAGGGTETTGNGYARQLCGFGAPAGSPRSMGNAGVITFPVQTPAAYPNTVAVGEFDAVSGGNLLRWVTATKTWNIGDQAQFLVGQLVASED